MNKKLLLVPIDLHWSPLYDSINFLTMEVNGDQQLFGSSKFVKIYYVVFNIRKKLIFENVWNTY